MKAYFVNLDRNEDRRQFMEKEFSDNNVHCERYPAFEGSACSDDELKKWSGSRPNTEGLGGWTKGNMGCFRSHYSLWEIAAKSDDAYTAIFEDDVMLSSLVGTLLNSYDWIPSDADIIRLEATPYPILMDKPVVHFDDVSTLRKVLPSKYKAAWPPGTGAYIISRDAAKRLIREPVEYHTHADHFLFNTVTSKVAARYTVYQVTPACAVQTKDAMDTANTVFASEIYFDAYMYDSSKGVVGGIKRILKSVGIAPAIRLSRTVYFYMQGYRPVSYMR